MDIRALMRPNIRALIPYTSARHEFSGNASVFLDANESPFPSSVNRYPDPLQKAVKNALGAIKNWDPKNIVLGNGSDELIDLIIRIFCEPGKDSILIFPPTYGMYKVYADINDIAIEEILLTADFNLPELSLDHIKNSAAKLLFICSPNNPTANNMDRTTMIEICKNFNGIVVVDEAYIDFSNQQSMCSEISEFSNLVVLQTFSKAWGLAGIRMGACYADNIIIAALNNVKPPYNINILSQRLALKALNEIKNYKENLRTIIAEREKLKLALKEINVIQKVYPSDTNFLLCKMNGNATDIYDFLVEKGIVVRNRSTTILCANCLRFTVGTPEENNLLINELSIL